MRHHKDGLKLGRESSHRNAMFCNMVTSLFKYTRIRTTDTKAKEIRRWADRMITLAKRGDLHARRQVMAVLKEKDVVHKLFAEAPERFKSSDGGYTRIVKLGRRPGDAAPVSLVELIAPASEEKKKEKKKPSKAAAKKKPRQARKTAKRKADAKSAAPEPENRPEAPAAEAEGASKA